jgi:hypothetical protein
VVALHPQPAVPEGLPAVQVARGSASIHPTDVDEAREWFDVPAAMGVEGLVVKGCHSRYVPGRRDWRKVHSRRPSGNRCCSAGVGPVRFDARAWPAADREDQRGRPRRRGGQAVPPAALYGVERQQRAFEAGINRSCEVQSRHLTCCTGSARMDVFDVASRPGDSLVRGRHEPDRWWTVANSIAPAGAPRTATTARLPRDAVTRPSATSAATALCAVLAATA